jgi:hypothetical protein
VLAQELGHAEFRAFVQVVDGYRRAGLKRAAGRRAIVDRQGRIPDHSGVPAWLMPDELSQQLGN